MRDDENRWETNQQDSDYGRQEGSYGEEGLGHAGQGATSTDPVENITRANDEGMPQSSEDWQDESGAGTESDQSERTGQGTSGPGF